MAQCYEPTGHANSHRRQCLAGLSDWDTCSSSISSDVIVWTESPRNGPPLSIWNMHLDLWKCPSRAGGVTTSIPDGNWTAWANASWGHTFRQYSGQSLHGSKSTGLAGVNSASSNIARSLTLGPYSGVSKTKPDTAGATGDNDAFHYPIANIILQIERGSNRKNYLIYFPSYSLNYYSTRDESHTNNGSDYYALIRYRFDCKAFQ